jgi:hypothetical protein
MTNFNQPLRSMSEYLAVAKRTKPPSLCVKSMLLAVSFLAMAGCGKSERPGPKTFPVSGQVVVARSRLPVGGQIEFKPKQNEFEFTAVAPIEENGKFTLRIPYVDRSLPGATEGPHNVRVILPLFGPGWHGGEVGIDEIFTVQPSENYFTIKLP